MEHHVNTDISVTFLSHRRSTNRSHSTPLLIGQPAGDRVSLMNSSAAMPLPPVERLLARVGDDTLARFLALSASHLGLCPDDMRCAELMQTFISLHRPVEEKP
jgi:hypothetical protein